MIKVEMGKQAQNILREDKFQPDGKYVPRILFFTSDGDLITEAYNKHPSADPDHKYFYNTPVQLTETMLFVLKEYCKDPLPLIFQHTELKPEICDMDDEKLTPTFLD